MKIYQFVSWSEIRTVIEKAQAAPGTKQRILEFLERTLSITKDGFVDRGQLLTELGYVGASFDIDEDYDGWGRVLRAVHRHINHPSLLN